MPDNTSLEKLSQRAAQVPTTITVPAYPVHTEEEDSLPLLEYWRILRKRRWTVLGVLLLVVVTVMIGTLKQTPVYRAKAILQIDRESQNIVTFKEVVEVNPQNEDYLETAYKVLRSRTLARRVIDKLKLEQVPEFNTEPSWPSSLFRKKLPEDDPKIIAGEVRADPKHHRLIENFLERLTVLPVRNSRLVEIYFDSYDAALAARVVNTLAYEYINWNLQVKWDATNKASEWLSEQLAGLKAKLEKSEEDLARYAKEHSILFIDDKQSMGAQKLKQLDEEYTKAEAERIQKESLYNQVKSGDLISIPGMNDSVIFQQLTVKLADLKREYSEQSALFTPEYPKVKRLKAQIDEIETVMLRERESVARRVTDDYRAAVNRVRLLKDVVGQQTREFNDIAERSIQYNLIKREVDTNKQLYEGLLQRLKEAGVSAGLKASNIRVVDEAEVPPKPARPRVMMNLALALVLGLSLGIGMAVFQEYLDNTLKTPDDVQRFLQLPALGVIPSASGNGRARLGYGYGYGYGIRKRLPKPAETSASGESTQLHPELIGSDTNAQLAEAYRSLRTSVLLSTSGRPPRIILITSAQPGEGKTTTVVNLAITLAQLGSRVLVVDSDMRKPRIAGLLKLKPPQFGLSTFLTGQSTLDEAVMATPVPNLYAIPCGPIPPNPAELVSSELMGQMVSQAKEKFEYVLLDSPPVLHVADSRILAAQVEAVILVAHGGSTPRELVNHAKNHLVQVNANVIGVALNNVDFAAVGYDYYYRYYRGYGYRYGYGYGYGGYGRDDSQSESDSSKA